MIQIDSLSHFITEIMSFATDGDGIKCYRGQRDYRWENVPGLFRPDLVNLAANEKRAVRDLISVHPQEFLSDETMFDKLVRMQHFGLPTRLMDVSLNPLISLFFATGLKEGETSDGKVTAFTVPSAREKYFDSDAVSALANLANMTEAEKNDIIRIRKARKLGAKQKEEILRINKEETYERLHQFIRSEKPYFLPIINPIDLFKPYFVHPKLSNRRIIAQSGAFIIFGLQPPSPITFAKDIVETIFHIPEGIKSGLRNELSLLGINDSTAFPELDRAAKRIEQTYKDWKS